MFTTRRNFVNTATLSGLSLTLPSVFYFHGTPAVNPPLMPTPDRVTKQNEAIVSQTTAIEPIIDPDLPIIDPHHHLWVLSKSFLRQIDSGDSVFTRGLAPVFHSHQRYLLDELLADVTSGHNVRATVCVECGTMYRASGPEAMRPVGEVEFANGIAAMAASGLFGEVKVCAGIIGAADLSLGDPVQDVLRAQIQAGCGRFRGVRGGAFSDPDSKIIGAGFAHPLLDKNFRVGFKWLHKLGLSFDALALEPQLPEVVDLARTFPDTQIILNHVGVPLGTSSYAGKREERFPIWRSNIRALAHCENVAVKLGGLADPLLGFKSWMAARRFTSEQLAAEWKPYIETCIEAFGANRCMFKSDFPIGSGVCSYAVLWNAYKRLAYSASKAEKNALFGETAERVYRLNI
jgi:L-fuconolactonase